MKTLVVPPTGTNVQAIIQNNTTSNLISSSNSNPIKNSNCNFHKDALLGFALDLPDEQLDSAVIQLQAAAAEQQNNNKINENHVTSSNNNGSNSNSGDYHSTLLNCVDLLPPSTVAANELPECYQFADADNATSELVNVANKDCDSLAKLAYNLYRIAKDDHIVIDRKRNEVIRTDAVTNLKTIYRCMDPINMGMSSTGSGSGSTSTSTSSSCSLSSSFSAMRNRCSSTANKTTRGRKRTATATTAPYPSLLVATNGGPRVLTEPMPAADADSLLRTRSGRIVRAALPQAASATKISGSTSTRLMQMYVADVGDKDYRPSTSSTIKTSVIIPPGASAASAEDMITTIGAETASLREPRAVPQNAVCPGCNKIFLGRRLQRHFVNYPEHMPSAIAAREQQEQSQATQQHNPQQQQQMTPNNVPTLFGLFTTQLQRHAHLNEEQRADLFLHELNDFVEQLQLRSTRLIRNTSGLHFVNARTARVLGIPEGQYALDMSAMESPQAPTPEPEMQQMLLHTVGVVPGPRNLVDYPGMSMSMDDTLTDEAAQRLNLSAGGKLLPPSEESLLRNVSDLMQPPVAVVVAPPTVGHDAGAMLPHYDHVSDNAVEALNMKETPNAAILDLNVDFFQFNNN